MNCRERMEAYLRENDVPFEVRRHDTAYTMSEVAAVLHESGRHVAKVVMVRAGEEMVMLVLPSSYRLNMDHVRDMLAAGKVRLADEEEFDQLFGDCAPGAMPPFGNLYGVPVYVERALAEQKEISFRAGTHQHVIEMAFADFERLVQPTVGAFGYVP
jgi:Ala-tRNA(Pro) deacylase